MKKINLIIFPGNFLPHIGGLETHVDEFAKYLSKNKNYKITIFAPNVANGLEKEVIHSNIKVLRYPAFEIVSNFPFPKFWHPQFWNMYFNLYHQKYDIVMTRTRFFSNSTIGMFFAKFRISPKKLIHVEHGSDFVILNSKFKTKIAKLYDLTFGKLIFLVSDKVVAISQVSYDFVCKNFVKKDQQKVSLITRGVDFEIYKKKPKKNHLKQFDDKIKIVFLGRLFKWKGVENSIKAYQNLPKNIQKKCVFIIVGDGEDYDRLKQKAGIFLNNGIYMFGKKSFLDSIEILKQSDIYLHSAYKGGALSNSVLQAMMCKLAIVASPNEGADEIIFDNKTGILLKDNSKEELQKGLKILIENKKLRQKYSKAAKQYVEKNFNWDNVIVEYKKIFEEVNR